MTPKLSLVDGDTLVVSPSQLEVIRTCPAMWRWKHLYRRVRAVANPAALGGGAFDAALNLRYTRHGGAPCAPETEQAMLDLIDKAYEGVDLALDEHRTPARYKEAIVAYNQHWQQEPFRVLGVQVAFCVELGVVDVVQDTTVGLPPKVRVRLRGISDLEVEMDQHTILYDTKTSNNDVGTAYSNSAQLKSYIWGLQEYARLHPEKGLPKVVHAATINGVVIRPDYKNPNRTATGKDKPRLEFQRPFPTFYSAERLERWRRNALVWVKQALDWVAHDVFPENERHCTFHMDAAFKNYGTYGQNCPYLGVCESPESQQEMVLGCGEYTDYQRSPLDGRDDGAKGEEQV